MGRYLEMLLAMDAKLQKPQTGSLQNPQNPEPYPGKGGFEGFEGTPSPTLPEIHKPAESIGCRPVMDIPSHWDAADGALRIEHTCQVVAALQSKFLRRAHLVDEAELHGIQRTLMRHVIDCQVCNFGHHVYCPDGERIGLGYWSFLFEFPDGDDRHREYVKAVALARSAGLKAGFSALLRIYSSDGGNRLESHLGAAWLAFDEHTATCTSCLRRAGRYCGEGHMLRNAAMMEREQ